MEARDVTIGILNYNGISALPKTLEALGELRHPPHSIVVADNASTDGSREWLQQNRPDIKCVCLPSNVGAAGGRNAILTQAETELILFLDNDISVDPDSLDRLLQAMSANPQAAICHPEIVDPLDPTVHHYNGGWTHFLGIYISRPKPDSTRPPFEVFPNVSGAAMLVRKTVAMNIGSFDTDYFFNKEDGDFTTRATLAGFQCINVPAAIVHHRSKPRGTSKTFYQVRNRWYFVLKLYSWRTLFLTSPMFVAFEFVQALFMLQKRVFGEYVRGNVAAVRDARKVLEKRRAFFPLKKVRDRDWLRTGPMFVPVQLRNSGGLAAVPQRVFETFCQFYWMLVGRLC